MEIWLGIGVLQLVEGIDIGSCLVDGSIKHGLLVCVWSLVDLLAAKGMIDGLIRLLINS